jgi:hypothetical protein
VSWRRCSRRRGRSRRRRRSCSRSGSSPSADDLLSSSRDGGCRLRPWRVGGAPVHRVPPQLDAAAAPSSPSLSRCAHWRRRKGKPQWGWWLGRSGLSLPLPLKPGAANVGAKAPIMPRLGPAGRPRRHLLPPRQPRCRGVRCRGKRGSPAPGPGSTRVHARAPAPRRAGKPDGECVPSRVRGRGAGRPVRRISEAREERMGIGMS